MALPAEGGTRSGVRRISPTPSATRLSDAVTMGHQVFAEEAFKLLPNGITLRGGRGDGLW